MTRCYRARLHRAKVVGRYDSVDTYAAQPRAGAVAAAISAILSPSRAAQRERWADQQRRRGQLQLEHDRPTHSFGARE